MSQRNWEADKILDFYIHDYLMKKQLHATARIFRAEGNVPTGPAVYYLSDRYTCRVRNNAPGGFLLEWWSIFWDFYIATVKQKHPEAAVSYSKKQQEQELQNTNQNQQMQLLLQRHAWRQQQQRLRETQLISGSASCPISNDPLMRQNLATSNAMATKIYEDMLKLPLQKDALDDASIQQKVLDVVGRLLNPNHALLLKAAATTGEQATGQTLLSAPSILQGNIQHVQNLNQKLPGSTQDKKSDMNAMMKSQAVVSEESFIGCHEVAFKDMRHIMASSHKVECCHFSSDGKILATGGHDNKASLWCTELFNLKSTLEEHSEWITDVRFCPSMLRVATSSADETVRVWDVDNPSYSLQTFTGHSTTVMSLDFHPSKDDLICSCDNSEIRYWSIKNGNCTGLFKGGATQMRFQPCLGRLLAAATDNFVSIFDVETLGCSFKLQGHTTLVRSVCWDLSGKFLASLSADMVRVWSVASGGKGECIQELKASGNKFSTCVFHPFYPLLVIGCHETLELWDLTVNKTMTLHAHDDVVSSLAVSNVTGLVASTSHDKHFKIWK